jgi:hypothetical protein
MTEGDCSLRSILSALPAELKAKNIVVAHEMDLRGGSLRDQKWKILIPADGLVEVGDSLEVAIDLSLKAMIGIGEGRP